jgi:hypothetical protein
MLSYSQTLTMQKGIEKSTRRSCCVGQLVTERIRGRYHLHYLYLYHRLPQLRFHHQGTNSTQKYSHYTGFNNKTAHVVE